MPDRFAVLMAGGKGTRFWPQSRASWPKQFLPIGGGGRSLLRAAVDRIAPLIDPQHVYVVTSAVHAAATAEQLPEVPPGQILAEPVGRNTAPCVGWAAATIARRNPGAVLAVLPADPYIEDENGYRAALDLALSAATGDAMVTIGIAPTRPETGYGYIETGPEVIPGVREVVRFVEKPDVATAAHFATMDSMLWNSGMFFFRAQTLLDATRKHLPDLHAALARLDAAAARGGEADVLPGEYAAMDAISIDHGIMEKAQGMRVVPAAFGWHDVGGWASAWELASRDAAGNAVSGRALLIDGRNCYVAAGADRLVAVVGAENLVIVDTHDALLVVPRERAQDVRAVVDALKARGEEELL